MPLSFHPATGTIVICDFSTGFVIPEMVKARPVVIISPRFRTRPNLCTVIPISSSEPTPVEDYHHRLSDGAYPPAKGPVWAKCDMIATVGLARLDRIKTGFRTYETFTMPSDDMHAIRNCLLHALGLKRLTNHL